MDQVEELLAAIEDAKVASKAEILPDEPARRAVWMAQEMPKWTWSWLRRIVADSQPQTRRAAVAASLAGAYNRP